MRKTEFVYRDVLYWSIEKKKKKLTQLGIAKNLGISLSTVNHALLPLKKIGAIRIKPMLFEVLDERKILLHWASRRNIDKDVLYKTRVDESITEIEKSMPPSTILGAYTAYKIRYKEVPADYSEVFVYGDLKAISERFPAEKGPPNLFVLKKDPVMDKYGNITTIAHTYVDIWNINTWYAQEFIKALEKRIFGE